MISTPRSILSLLTGWVIVVCTVAMPTSAQPQAPQKVKMTQHAQGGFDVKVTPQQADNEVSKAANLGRFTIDKQFHGDLEATSKGEMLGVQGEVKGSAGYVAMERVTGTLAGKKGSFVLQHLGTMERGSMSLNVTVVPDSGTGELTGIRGTMKIIIEGGKHAYQLDYRFDPTK